MTDPSGFTVLPTPPTVEAGQLWAVALQQVEGIVVGKVLGGGAGQLHPAEQQAGMGWHGSARHCIHTACSTQAGQPCTACLLLTSNCSSTWGRQALRAQISSSTSASYSAPVTRFWRRPAAQEGQGRWDKSGPVLPDSC